MNADLAAVPAADLVALAGRLSTGRTIEHLRIPQQGLWLLQMAEPVRGDGFFLGEVPMAQAAVAVTDPRLGTIQGGAVLLGAEAATAVAAAVCVAIADAGWDGSEAVRALAARGAASRAAQSRVRAAILDRTRVDFAELGQEAGA